MNRVIVIGNLTKDVEAKTAESGKVHAHFTVASDRSRNENSATDFFRVSAFDKVAENAANFAKGAFVKVTGTVRLGEYEGRPTIEIVARKIEPATKAQAESDEAA